jgi:hypothetical protein
MIDDDEAVSFMHRPVPEELSCAKRSCKLNPTE